MRPLLTADVLNTCSQEYEEREEEMDTVIEKIFKKLNSCTTLELHFTVRCYHAYPCILSYIFTTMNCVLNTLTAWYGVWLGFVGCTCVCVFGQGKQTHLVVQLEKLHHHHPLPNIIFQIFIILYMQHDI